MFHLKFIYFCLFFSYFDEILFFKNNESTKRKKKELKINKLRLK